VTAILCHSFRSCRAVFTNASPALDRGEFGRVASVEPRGGFSSALLLSRLTGGVAIITSRLLLSLQSGLSFGSLGVFRLAGLVLGFQGSLARGGLGGFRGDPRSRFPSVGGRLGGLPFGDTGIAGDADRTPNRAALDGGGTVDGRSRSGGALQLELPRIRGGFQAIAKIGVFDVLIPISRLWSALIPIRRA
jgi:hypothetical protein